MAQQTCCISSRPASRLVDRSLSRFSSNPRFAKRLGRIARRALAAMLIVGGTSLGTSQATVAAHEHMPAADESVNVDMTANPLPSRLVGDAILGQWLSSVEAAELVCGPAREIVDIEMVHSAGPLAATHQVVLGGGGVLSIYPTTTNQWHEYCELRNLLAWGDQAKHWTSPVIQQVDKTATELAKADEIEEADGVDEAAAEVRSRSLLRGLSDLSCEEPIDIAPTANSVAEVVAAEASVVDAEIADASEAPKFSSAALVGGGPLVATIEEAYLAYDLSPEDVIAMRMYPIDGPAISGAPISYLGARRTSIYGPVPNFEANGNWHQQVEPGIVVSTLTADAAVTEVVSEAPAPAEATALPDSVVQSISDAAQWVVAAVQPDSDVRRLASVSILSKRIGDAAGAGVGTADVAVGQMATRLAAVLQPQPRPLIAPPAEKLVAQATLETPRPVIEPVVEPGDAPDDAFPDAQLARLMQIEIACKAALDVVKQQAARGPGQAMVPEQVLPAEELVASSETSAESFEIASIEAVASETPADELVRAQAVATACDLAADSLEKIAISLRRAGDSLVRQAKASGGNKESLLR